MQTTSSGYSSVVNASYRQINTGVSISWLKTVASGVNFFTVGTSLIAGVDILGTGDSVSLFDKYQYSDYTDKVKSWSVDRKIGQFPFGILMAQADVELDNSSNLFSPNYDATIGSGILPNRPLRISVGMGQDSFQQFLGFTGQPEISIMEREVYLHSYDVVDYLNNYRFATSSGLATTVSGTLLNYTASSGIRYYLGKLGFNTSQMQLDASLQDPIGFISVIDRKFGEVLYDLISAEQGLFFADERGIPTFWNRQHFNTTSGTGARFNYNYSNTISIDYENTPVINDVLVTAKPRAVSSVAKRLWSLSLPQSINGSSTLDVFASFSDDNGSLPVVSVTTPTGSTTDLATSFFRANDSSDGTGTDRTSSVSVSSTFLFGTTYRITLSNSYASTVYLTNLVLYGLPAEVKDVIQQNYQDTASIAAYGRNPSNNGETLEISNDYIQSSSQALSMGYQLVNQYKTPNRRYKVEVFSNPSLQIGDYGTIDPLNNGQLKNVWVTGKTDKLAPNGDLTQVLILDERTILSYFTIGTSLIGGSDSIAP